MNDPDYAYWCCVFQHILNSKHKADRLVDFITAYAVRSGHKWDDVARSAKYDLLRGKTIEEIFLWFASRV